MEKPYTGRAIITDDCNGIEIVVPAKKNWVLIVFLSFWLCGWFGGEFFVSTTVFFHKSGGPDGFLTIWLLGWTAGGFFVVSTLWWNYAGKEIITIAQGVLTIVKKGSVAKTRSYDMNEAKNFRAIEEDTGDFSFGNRRGMSNPWNPAGNGAIKFDYGMQTVKFGDKLYQAEAEYILDRMRNKKLIS